MRWAVMAAVLAGCAGAATGGDGGTDVAPAGSCPEGYVARQCAARDGGTGSRCASAPGTRWTASVTHLAGVAPGRSALVTVAGWSGVGATATVAPGAALPARMDGVLTGVELERLTVTVEDPGPGAPPGSTVRCAGPITVYDGPALPCPGTGGLLLPGNPVDGYGQGIGCDPYDVWLRFDRVP